jgi:predicted Zn-dependent protease with MMP-like domain
MHVSRKVFDGMVETAIAGLPEEYARWLEEVPVIVEDRPGKADEADDAVGLYSGQSRTERGVEDSGMVPARIMIYRIPLMEACSTREELAEEIRKTLWHELGHHAGLDEEDLDRLGYGPLEEDDDIQFDVDEEEP